MTKYLGIIFLTLVLTSWYGRIDHVESVQKEVDRDITIDEAIKNWGATDITRQYSEKYNVAYNRKRTLIPFIFKNDTLSKTKVTLWTGKLY